MECLRLRAKDVDYGSQQMIVGDGKEERKTAYGKRSPRNKKLTEQAELLSGR